MSALASSSCVRVRAYLFSSSDRWYGAEGMDSGIGRGGGEVVPQLATEPVEPKPDAEILPRQCKCLIASVSRLRASATGSS